jgi:thymidine kinase
MNKGSLEVICGPMFCGKSEELIRRIRRAEIAKQTYYIYKPVIDDRFSQNKIVSRAGVEKNAIPIKDATDALVWGEYDIAAFDEAQFFDKRLIYVVKELLNEGKRVIISGLDQDFREFGFGPMPELLAMADNVLKLTAICVKCHKEATTTQRLINGKPAEYDEETILVGNTESYEARCRDCHEEG